MTRISLTKKEKECVKEWLENRIYHCCPFEGIRPRCKGYEKAYKVCRKWFPKNYLPCPCDNYKLSTVIRRAKEMVK